MTDHRVPPVLALALVLSAIRSLVTQLVTGPWIGGPWIRGLIPTLYAIDLLVLVGLSLGLAQLGPRLSRAGAIAARLASVLWGVHAAVRVVDLAAVIATREHLWEGSALTSYLGLLAFCALLYTGVDRRRPYTIALAVVGVVLVAWLTGPVQALMPPSARDDLRLMSHLFAARSVALDIIALLLVTSAARRGPQPQNEHLVGRGLRLASRGLYARVVIAVAAMPITVVARNTTNASSDWIVAAALLAAGLVAVSAFAGGLVRASRWSAPGAPRWRFAAAATCVAIAACAHVIALANGRDRTVFYGLGAPIDWLAPTFELAGIVLAISAIATTAASLGQAAIAERARQGAWLVLVAGGLVIAIEPAHGGSSVALWSLLALAINGGAQWWLARLAGEVAPADLETATLPTATARSATT